MMGSAKTNTSSIDNTKKEAEEEEEVVGRENLSSNMKTMKYCTDCKTTKTPLWRGGPSGPKSLCNACGIRYRKKRVSTMPLKLTKKREKVITTTTSSSGEVNGYGKKDLGELIVILGKDLLLQNSIVKKQRCQRKRKKMGEEELAAVSLMALSCGVVFA